MKLNTLRQLAGLNYGLTRIIVNTKNGIVSWYKAFVFMLSAGLIILGLKLGILRK